MRRLLQFSVLVLVGLMALSFSPVQNIEPNPDFAPATFSYLVMSPC